MKEYSPIDSQIPDRQDQVLPSSRPGKKWLNRARSSILAGLAGAVLLPAAACTDKEPSVPKAMIVDQLALTDSNPQFLSVVGGQFLRNGYKLSYVPTGDVYVDFYRNLPRYDSSVIIIRGHSSNLTATGNVVTNNDVILFTSQPYSNELYLDDQSQRELSIASMMGRTRTDYFGINSKFVENEMYGKFKKGSTVIVMGCNSLSNASFADALFKKGVSTYFGFEGSVTAEFTDKATAVLVNHLYIDGMTPQAARDATVEEVGTDPVYGGKLLVLQNQSQ